MTSSLVLANGVVINSERWFQADLRIEGSRISEIGPGIKAARGETEIDCSDCFIYPGLINSHEHLDFNLYSRLGEPPYANAYEWGNDLHSRWKTEIASIQKIPFSHRLWWGAWKNLFSGVTRVVHHDPYYPRLRLAYPVDVLKLYTFAHSLKFDPDLKGALARRKPATPFMIHLAEGRDEESRREISELDNLGGIDPRTVAVHAINAGEDEIDILRRRGASVIWCPSSNSYLFGKTAPIHLLHNKVPVALGTDSSLTGAVSLFDELRAAQSLSALSSHDLFQMVTVAPRSIFGLSPDAGGLVERGRADLFIVPATKENPYDRLVRDEPGDIRLLMASGRPILVDRSFAPQLTSEKDFRLPLNGREKAISSGSFKRLFPAVAPYLSHYSYLSSVGAVYDRPGRS
jgi:cytosine/adenosine deaminase-related metal-dependent hydrolase